MPGPDSKALEVYLIGSLLNLVTHNHRLFNERNIQMSFALELLDKLSSYRLPVTITLEGDGRRGIGFPLVQRRLSLLHALQGFNEAFDSKRSCLQRSHQHTVPHRWS